MTNEQELSRRMEAFQSATLGAVAILASFALTPSDLRRYEAALRDWIEIMKRGSEDELGTGLQVFCIEFLADRLKLKF